MSHDTTFIRVNEIKFQSNKKDLASATVDQLYDGVSKGL
jgi:hypothetical protein